MRLSAAPLGELPPVTRALAIAFFAGWLAELVLGFKLNFYFGLVPFNVLRQGWLWQPFTYIFIHAGFWHFLFNTFMLWMLGRMLEPEMGSRKFLLYFVACGAAAALLTVAWTPGSLRPVIGASGAVYGLLGAFAFLYPDATVNLYFIFPMSARAMAVLLGLTEFALTMSGPGSNISNVTHLGGLAAGLGWLWAERRLAGREAPYEPPPPDAAAQERAEVDRLLDKVSARGQAALSRAELKRLDDYARKRGGRA
ncbi:MAG TPA: rhomboid family intramembrane serine protease [Elusimicrobiales bacterium]|nr:rhomboid family intramembrane serine protease [Elusimicrobiales bacterium]